MWRLKDIKINNIATFHNAGYSFRNNVATLIYGENMDNESQLSNGAGKSALGESIAFCLTGSPLRPVKNDEIINNDMDQASVSLTIDNATTDETMRITRTISRKGSQKVEISISKNGDDEISVTKSSVDEYNKYVIEKLGITKDELYSSFILCKSRYKDFIISSDKEKKEVINKFSRGNLVDQSIEALEVDLEKERTARIEKEMEKNKVEGRIEAYKEAIENERRDAESNKRNKMKRISSLREEILRLQDRSLDLEKKIANKKMKIANVKSIAGKINDYEDNDYDGDDFLGVRKRVSELFPEFDGSSYSVEDLNNKITEGLRKKSDSERRLKDLESSISEAKANLKQAKVAVSEYVEKVERKKEEYGLEKKKAERELAESSERKNALRKDVMNLQRESLDLETKLAKTITCPHCGGKFVMSSPDFDIEKAQKRLDEISCLIESKRSESDSLSARCSKIETELSGKKAVLNDMLRAYDSLAHDASELKRDVESMEEKRNKLNWEIRQAETDIKLAEKSKESMLDDMMEDLFNQINKKIKTLNEAIESDTASVKNISGMISSKEGVINDLENESVTDHVESITRSLDEQEKALETINDEMGRIDTQLRELEEQESRFNSFKTYLANGKIDSLSEITNDFLERIGSDLRVQFDGYTLLRSGKVRDKISVSILRDGINIGNVSKLSVGEMSRVQLATILAMNHLTNLNADDGKGLDLLLVDEVLDGVDESGLDNIIKSINKIGITSLIISHGKTAESYPHKLVIRKQNGISTING